jgi:hypothetical protein
MLAKLRCLKVSAADVTEVKALSKALKSAAVSWELG